MRITGICGKILDMMNNKALIFLSDDESIITLSTSQKELIAQMKSFVDVGQLLDMLQESGKTTISRYTMREQNLIPHF